VRRNQLNQLKEQVNITPIRQLTFLVAYQKTKFQSYSINYLTLGASVKLDL